MTPPRIIVYAADRAFRVQCAAVLRGSGANARLASGQAELAKAIADASSKVIIVGDAQNDADVARTVAAASPAPLWLIMQRALGESIEEIAARALVAAYRVDQPRSSE